MQIIKNEPAIEQKETTSQGCINIHQSAFGHVKYCLCMDRKEVKYVADHYKFCDALVEVNESLGSVNYIYCDDGTELAIVQLDTSQPFNDCLASLVHESVHIASHMMEIIGETSPSKEFLAYSIDNIFANIYKDFKTKTSQTGEL